MIYYLACRHYIKTMQEYLQTFAPDLMDCICPISYHNVSEKLLPGTYIFADVERLNAKEFRRANRLWHQLSRRGNRLLNSPESSMRRYRLLRHLYSEGINTFNVFRLRDRFKENVTYPVFLRRENDHGGPTGGLIATPIKLFFHQLCHPKALITEFCDTRSSDGLFRKYSALRIGNDILPRHIFFSTNWMVKNAEICNENLVAEELVYLNTNPHEKELMTIFEMANIEYGRIDYSLCQGRIQVWEINTNPTVLSNNSLEIEQRRIVAETFEKVFRTSLMNLNEGKEGYR